jgi:hypothetical protein
VEKRRPGNMNSLLTAPLQPVEIFLIGLGIFMIVFTYVVNRTAK